MPLFNKIKKIFVVKPNELTFWRQYEYHGNYHDSEKMKIESIKNIILKFRDNPNKNGVNIESIFNGIKYPVFDIDHKEYLEF